MDNFLRRVESDYLEWLCSLKGQQYCEMIRATR